MTCALYALIRRCIGCLACELMNRQCKHRQVERRVGRHGRPQRPRERAAEGKDRSNAGHQKNGERCRRSAKVKA